MLPKFQNKDVEKNYPKLARHDRSFETGHSNGSMIDSTHRDVWMLDIKFSGLGYLKKLVLSVTLNSNKAIKQFAHACEVHTITNNHYYVG